MNAPQIVPAHIDSFRFSNFPAVGVRQTSKTPTLEWQRQVATLDMAGADVTRVRSAIFAQNP